MRAMCEYFSCIVTRDLRILWCEEVSHEATIARAGLKDDYEDAVNRPFVRLEVPEGDMDRYRVDEESTLPLWYIIAEDDIRGKVKKLVRKLNLLRQARNKLYAEQQTAWDKLYAEQQSARGKLYAERQPARDKLNAEQRQARDKLNAEQRQAWDKLDAEQQPAKDKLDAEQQLVRDKLDAEQRPAWIEMFIGIPGYVSSEGE